MHISVTGGDFDGFRKKFAVIANQGAFFGANEIRTNIILSMQEPKSGHIYNVRKRKYNKKTKTVKTFKSMKAHQASAPGQAPAVDTGRLIASIMPVTKQETGHATIAVMCNYAEALDKGTTRMRARPFSEPAINKSRPVIVAWIKNKIKGMK
jgi:hypothetical protein